jgi:lantibiotic modifying enzyme
MSQLLPQQPTFMTGCRASRSFWGIWALSLGTRDCKNSLAWAVIELLKTPSLRERGRPAGAFAGLGGVIYVLAHLSQFMPDLSCADIAEQLARLLAEDLDAAAEIDVIAGLAGLSSLL